MLKRDLNLIGLLFLSTGSIIGSGWLFSAYYSAKIAGPASIVSWIIGAVLMLIIALCYAEIGSRFPAPSNVVQIMQCAYGSGLSFLTGWISSLSFIFVAPIEVQATLQYSGHFFPFLLHNTATTKHVLSGYGFVTAIVLLAIIMTINLFSIKLLSKLNEFLVWWKLLIPTLAILAIVTLSFHSANFTEHGGFLPFGWHGVLSAVSGGGIIYAFMGFREVIDLAGEAKNPRRNIPIALIGSVVLACILYTTLQFVYLVAIKPVDIRMGWDHLLMINGVSPMISLALMLGLTWLAGILYIDAIISPLGTGLIINAGSARVPYAMGLAGYMPKAFSKTNRFHIPVFNIILTFILGILFLSLFSGWQSMMSFIVLMTIFAYGSGTVSVMVLRKQFPLTQHSADANGKKPFTLPLPCLFSFLGFYFCNLIILWSGWQTYLKLFITVLIGIVIMFWLMMRYSRQHRERHLLKEISYGAWFLLYLLGMLVIVLFSNFGHGLSDLSATSSALITLGWSAIIFIISQYCYLPDAIAHRYKLSLMEATK